MLYSIVVVFAILKMNATLLSNFFPYINTYKSHVCQNVLKYVKCVLKSFLTGGRLNLRDVGFTLREKFPPNPR